MLEEINFDQIQQSIGMWVRWKKDSIEHHPIDKKDMLEQKLYFVTNLVPYVQKHLSIPFEIEVVYQGRVCDGTLPWQETSKENPFHLYLKHIWNTKSEKSDQDLTDTFFQQREISLKDGLLLDRKLQKCFDRLKVPCSISNSDLKYLLKSYKMYDFTNELTKYPLINRFLEYAFEVNDDDDNNRYKIRNAYEIKAGSHKAVADFYAFDIITKRGIVIGEGKKHDFIAGLLQNFDQLRSYSMSILGKHLEFIYGVITTLETWTFTCYVVPQGDQAAAYNNFLVSNTIHLTIDQNNLPTRDSINSVITYLKVFLNPQIDKVVKQE